MNPITILQQGATAENTAITGIILSGAVTLVLFLVKWIFDQISHKIEEDKQSKIDEAKAKALAEKEKADALARAEKERSEQKDRDLKEIQDQIRNQNLIDESNTRLAMSLRDEMKRDRDAAAAENAEMRQRLRDSETKNAKTEARVEELSKINDGLRRENMDLSTQNGAQRKELDIQSDKIKEQDIKLREQDEKIKQQAEQINQQAGQVGMLVELVGDLIGAMKSANIDIPDNVKSKIDNLGTTKRISGPTTSTTISTTTTTT